jgi:hypothetical protein
MSSADALAWHPIIVAVEPAYAALVQVKVRLFAAVHLTAHALAAAPKGRPLPQRLTPL